MPRKRPYTALGVTRLKCAVRGCKRRAVHQWQICADRRVFRPICAEHDIGINRLVMRYVFGRTRETDMAVYAAKVRSE